MSLSLHPGSCSHQLHILACFLLRLHSSASTFPDAQVSQAHYERLASKLAAMRAQAEAVAVSQTPQTPQTPAVRLFPDPPDNAGHWVGISSPDSRHRYSLHPSREMGRLLCCRLYAVTKREEKEEAEMTTAASARNLLDLDYQSLMLKAFEINVRDACLYPTSTGCSISSYTPSRSQAMRRGELQLETEIEATAEAEGTLHDG